MSTFPEAPTLQQEIRRFRVRIPNRHLWLLYLLTEEKSGQGTGSLTTVYSVIIQRLDGGGQRECARLLDIARNFRAALRIFRRLADGCVTPYAADEVMEILLEEELEENGEDRSLAAVS